MNPLPYLYETDWSTKNVYIERLNLLHTTKTNIEMTFSFQTKQTKKQSNTNINTQTNINDELNKKRLHLRREGKTGLFN